MRYMVLTVLTVLMFAGAPAVLWVLVALAYWIVDEYRTGLTSG